MKWYPFLVFMAVMFIEAAGSDVVIGILGNSVSIDCKLPVAESIIWESRTVGVIAVNSVVRRSSKYSIVTYNGARESLVIHNVTLTDKGEYRCYSVHDKQDFYVTFLNVLEYQDDSPVEATTVNDMVYVAGGLISFAGLMIIVTIVIILTRNRRKNTSSPEEALSNKRRHNHGLAIGEKWWYTVRPADRPDISGNSTPALSRTTENEIQVVCSTPYYGNKQAIFNVEGNSPIPQEYNHIQQALQNLQTPEPINFSSFGKTTCLNVDPLIYNAISNNRTGQFLTINKLHSDSYKQNGSVFYKTINDSETSAGEYLGDDKRGIADAQSIDMCAVTLDKDYTEGDIADILDKTEQDRNDEIFDFNDPNSDIVINGTFLSFNVDFGESDTCAKFSSMSPTELNCSRDFLEDTCSVSFSSTLGSQQNDFLADDTTVCNITRATKNMDQTYTLPKNRGHQVRNSSHKTESDVSATLGSDLYQHRTNKSKRDKTYLNKNYKKKVKFQCGSNTDSSSDYCDKELCYVDQCTLTNNSKQDSLVEEYDTIITNELNRALSIKLRNNSFRTAIDNSLVDKTTTFPIGYTSKSDISATAMKETNEETGYRDEDHTFNTISSSRDVVTFV